MSYAARFLALVPVLAGTYIDEDGAYNNQCWDSVAGVSRLLGLPVLNTTGAGEWAGYAGTIYRDYPQTPSIAAAYEQIPPGAPAMAGDVAVWGDSNPYYPATHIANVIADAGGLLLCLSQNSSAARPDLPGYGPDSTGPTIVQHLPKRGLLGYLRPREGVAAQGTITQQEEPLKLDQEDFNTVSVIVRDWGTYAAKQALEAPIIDWGTYKMSVAQQTAENAKGIQALTVLVRSILTAQGMNQDLINTALADALSGLTATITIGDKPSG